MPNPKFHSLLLRDIAAAVHLGCTAEERLQTQEVRVNVEFRFAEMPPGAVSDRLEETICYAKIANAIQRHCENNEFNLIERMGLEVYKVCQQTIHIPAEIGVAIHKVKPPVAHLLGGSHYRCGDFLP